jgi:riboflavin biosynthesis pyrimidine reductase
VTSFDVLFPPGEPASAEALIEIPAGRCLRVNMVASLDGQVTRDGGSTGLGGEGDHALFHALREACDGVLAGTGTLRAENYGRLVRSPERRARRAERGLDEDPVMLVITRSGHLPWDARLFDTPEQRVLIAGPARVPAGVRAQVEVIDAAGPDEALDAFAERGVLRVLCEGGPALNHGLLAAELVDELFLTLDPTVAGGEALRLVTGAAFPAPIEWRLHSVLRHGDELLLRYSR